MYRLDCPETLQICSIIRDKGCPAQNFVKSSQVPSARSGRIIDRTFGPAHSSIRPRSPRGDRVEDLNIPAKRHIRSCSRILNLLECEHDMSISRALPLLYVPLAGQCSFLSHLFVRFSYGEYQRLSAFQRSNADLV